MLPGRGLPRFLCWLLESAYGLSCHTHAAIAVERNAAFAGPRNQADS